MRTKRPSSDWELLETINSPRIAEYALNDYEKIMSSEDERDIRMIRADNEAEARAKLEESAN